MDPHLFHAHMFIVYVARRDGRRAGQARAHHCLLDDDGRAAAGGRRVEREGSAQGIRQARRGRGQAGSAPAGLRAVCGRLRTVCELVRDDACCAELVEPRYDNLAPEPSRSTSRTL